MYKYLNGRPHLIQSSGQILHTKSDSISLEIPLSIGTNSKSRTIIRLIASILTSSGLSMPYLMSSCGVIVGTLLALLSMFIAIETSNYICAACDYTKQYTYNMIANTLLGRKISQFSSVLTVLLYFCFSVNYFNSLFSYLPNVVQTLFHIDIHFILDSNVFLSFFEIMDRSINILRSFCSYFHGYYSKTFSS